MLTPEQIRELEAFDGRGASVLSVFLDLEPALRPRRAHRIVFEDLVKEAREPLPAPAREALANEAAVVRQWLEGHEPRGKGLALFSCSPRKLWRAEWLAVRVGDHLAFEPRPDVGPLLDVLDEYERYAVALVDKDRARLFTVFMGEIEESARLEDPLVISRHDQGGISQLKHQHHQETHVLWHLERVARRLAELLRRREFDRLILAGPEEPTSELRRLLPRALAQRLVAVIPAEVFASDAEILAKTLEVERQMERELEDGLLEELFEIAGAHGRAVYGVGPTLEALGLGEILTLIVADGLRVTGSECTNCGRLEVGTAAACPACNGPMRPVRDLAHRVMTRARELGGGVEVVHGGAARRLLEDGGGLGALLRFRIRAEQKAGVSWST